MVITEPLTSKTVNYLQFPDIITPSIFYLQPGVGRFLNGIISFNTSSGNIQSNEQIQITLTCTYCTIETYVKRIASTHYTGTLTGNI